MTAWFDRAFGPWYERLYPHRDLAEAERALATVGPRLEGAGRVLDVGCGTGRHASLLARRGADVLGLDRSRSLLAAADRRPELRGRLLRADMRRLPVASGSMGAILSMFTSFGYFDDRRTHLDLLREFARVARREGTLVLDYLNPIRVRAGLVPASSREVDGHRVEERRRISRDDEGELVVKTVTVVDSAGTVVEAYEERVRLFEPDELEGMVESGGWRVTDRLGEYDGSPWRAEASRTLLLAVRRDEGGR